MAKILEFRLPEPKPQTREEFLSELLTAKQAVDGIVVGMLTAILPRWVENNWPFYILEMMAEELRANMNLNCPETVSRRQIETIVEELKPLWLSIVENATSHIT